MKGAKAVAGWLLVLGGISLGLDGLFDYNLLVDVLGSTSPLSRGVNTLIGISALWMGYDMLSKRK